ncbi:hypothetical protein kac65v162_gp194 [Nodularia phage vB_NspS-kac65v162]|uniref:Uncharacterized protein n=1 Tax=Nodularia phage vB_NspS-kac65v162 TaxID=2557581 RepID=A0A482MJ92_9CAUD|nr:hypothetical protein kac65v162_gp194 [Nodularia phage vB_NspS-kac65v162]
MSKARGFGSFFGKEIKLMKARTAVNDAVNKLVSNDSSLNQSDVMKEIISATLEQQYGKDSLAFKLHQEAAKSPKYKDEVGFALLAGSDRPSHLAKAAEAALDAQGKNSHRLVEDLVGSVTKNKAAQGHSDDYYKKDPTHSPNTEAFAYIISLYGSGSPLAVEVMENLTPGGYGFTKDILRKVGAIS